MASLSGDKVMLDLLNRGADLHGYAATKVLRFLKNDDTLIVDEQNNTKFRKAMKNVIFGLSYGAGIGKIAELLDISRDRATKVYDLLIDIFPQAFEMLEKNSKFGVQHGYIVFDRLLNQRRWFENLLKGDRSSATISSVERACKNSPIQGINGQMIKKALVDIDNYVEVNSLKSHIISTVHDEIVMLVADGEEEHCKHFHRLMADAGTYFLSGIEMKVESVLGESWSK
jgi:DNA polymerase-1